jgi:hypothetical protein
MRGTGEARKVPGLDPSTQEGALPGEGTDLEPLMDNLAILAPYRALEMPAVAGTEPW